MYSVKKLRIYLFKPLVDNNFSSSFFFQAFFSGPITPAHIPMDCVSVPEKILRK